MITKPKPNAIASRHRYFTVDAHAGRKSYPQARYT